MTKFLIHFFYYFRNIIPNILIELKVLLTFTYNVSLKDWDELGIIHREIVLYKKLSEKGIEYAFLTYGNNKDLEYNPLLDKIRIFPVLNIIKSKNFFIRLLKYLILPLKLKNLLKDIDIVKTNQLDGCWIGILAKLLYKKRLIARGGYEWFINFLNQPRKKGFKNYFKYLLNYSYIFLTELIAYHLANKIILTNKSDIDFIIKTFHLKRKRRKINYIPNFIDINLFRNIDIERKDKHILFIGRLAFEKNLLNLLKGLKYLEGFTLDIIGNGPLKKFLKDQAERLDIKVNFLHRFPNNKIPEILNQYQIFILPSFYESNPKALLEAMSCSIPCIGTNVRGINEIISHGENGYLCELSSSSIREAILTLYENKKLRNKIGKNARNFIVRNCSLDLIVQEEYNLYRDILK